MNKLTTFIFLAAGIICSCTKSDMDMSTPAASLAKGQQIVLGERLSNPYTLENMQRALDTLLQLKGVEGSIELEPTDYYVRFQPTDTTEYRALFEQDFELFDYPLDYEILSEGDSYHDPSIPDDQITWQYTVIPENCLTETIKYDKIYELKKIDGDVAIMDKNGLLMKGTIIDNCFIPKDELKSVSFTVSPEELEDMAIQLAANKTGGDAGEYENFRTMSSGGYPHGTVKVYEGDGSSGTLTGVPGVKVRARYFLKWKYAYTDSNGEFRFSSKFSKSPHISLVFDNSKGFTVWGNWAFLAPAQYTIGTYSPSTDIAYTISKSSKRNLWDWAVISKGSYDYFTSCTESEGLLDGVQTPPANMKIWCIGDFTDMASTPMARHLNVAKTLSAEATMLSFCTNCLGLQIASGLVSFALHIALPDMFIGTEEISYKNLYLRMFHEFSHASHFQQIGEWKWGDVIWYEMVHGSYPAERDGVRGEDYVELTESYSYAMQNYVKHKKFSAIKDEDDMSGVGKDMFFRVSTWHLTNLMVEDVVKPSSMSKALDGALKMNDLKKNLYLYNGGGIPQLNYEFTTRPIPSRLAGK